MDVCQKDELQNPPLFKTDLKQKRDEYNVEIRKQKRDENLRKLRISNLEIDKKVEKNGLHSLGGVFDSPENAELRKNVAEWMKRHYTADDFIELLSSINSNDRSKQYYGVIGLRKLLSQDISFPIKHMVEYNLIPKLIQFARNEDEPHLQLEAAWVLTNVASGTTKETQAIIDYDGIPCLINLLKSKKDELVEQVICLGIWALGNISNDCSQFRDIVLKNGGLDLLVQVLSTTNNTSIIQHGIWALSSLCQGRPLPDFALVNKAIPIFARAIQQNENSKIITDSTWALFYLSQGDSNQIQKLLGTELLPSLVMHLESKNLSILVPVIRIIGNITLGNEEQIDALLQVPNIISNLFKLTGHIKRIVKSEVCWILSNITEGNERQIEAVISHPDYLNKLITMAISEKLDVQREAVYVLSNATKNCNLNQVFRMAQYGIMECFSTLLESSEDPKILEATINGLDNLMNKGKLIAQERGGENPFFVEFSQRGCISRIDHLQKHQSEDVYKAAVNLLENHFELEDEN